MAMAIMVLSFTACTDDSDDNLETGGDDQKAYTVKQVPVNRNGEPGGTVAIRFYEDMPSVPYISVADFQNVVVPGTTVSVTKQQDNIYLLNNAGSTATVDTKAETIAFDDYMAFTNQMELVQPGMENAYYDDTPFVRFTHQTLVGGSAAKKNTASTYVAMPRPCICHLQRSPTSIRTYITIWQHATAKRW